ncbi:putative bifunctional diguanylate cyclase/phosphodiesterase [Aliidiomarina sanyensis]|uniref:Sensor domain-containing diguanylate cyclase n=1 Tax=Aliidiomarina sanyensis TaxID=1249555 RepID=A0A432WI03_9GAMM|nr:GGDEF domain-containing phosphodiesterase [Aliidiomarina sanyensis]RUO33424.1 sensor domain-containing diguanylate cyclase [Aliidiomarina sanyensis]
MTSPFSRFSFASLRFQFVLLVMVLGTFTIALSTFAIVQDQVRTSHEHSERELRTMSIFVQASANRALRYALPEALEEIMAETAAHRRVQRVVMYRRDGAIAHSVGAYLQDDASLTDKMAVKLEQTQISERISISFMEDRNTYVAAIPVLAPGELLGVPNRYVMMIEYLHPITAADAFANRIGRILVAACALVGIYFLLFWYWRTWVSQPSQALIQALKKARDGEAFKLDKEIKTQELRVIVDAVADMVAQRDIHEEKLRKLTAAVEQSHEGILITNRQGTIEYVNDAVVKATGYSEDELLGQNPRMLGSGQTPASTFASLWKAILNGQSWTGEFYNRRKDGSEYIELQTVTPLKDKSGEVTHFLGIKQDITEQKSIQERLHFLAYFDTLTHLPNRTSVLDMLRNELEVASRKQSWGAVVLINIDRMKDINDARGFQYGNDVLLAMTSRLTEHQMERHFLGHLGADTFCIVISAQFRDSMQIRTVLDEYANKLMALCQEPFDVRGERVQLTVSIGAAVFGELQRSADDVIQSAETALHNAKRKGGNQHLVYRPADGQEIERLYQTEADLRVAIEQGQLILYLQAQMDQAGELAGAEALVRWQHPQSGMVSPAEFIPIAERSDLIADLDRWVLRRSLEVLKRWQDRGQRLTMSVNISPRHIQSARFVESVTEILKETGADPTLLVLEVTEGLLVEDVEQSIQKMKALSELGIQFAIDDLGTGYSSLSYIRQLPVHELKIDQSFIRGIPHTQSDVTMVKTIVSFAQNLNLRVVAEGVETRSQSKFCEKLGIWGQGYFYEKPIEWHLWQRKWGVAM